MLSAAARGISTYGYANLTLAGVAKEAGYTRGAIYHQFEGKAELVLAVVQWVEETWTTEVRDPALAESTPLASLMALARGHAIYCRRDVARVMLSLRIEFAGQDHPVGRAVASVIDVLESDCRTLIAAARRDGSIPPGPPVRLTAAAFSGVLEAVGIELAGQAPHDVKLMRRAVRGTLGLPADELPDPAP
nr:TetR/AcrR family transcriptional regulator [Kribbella italica]